MPTIPSRAEVIREQRQAGRRIAAVLPIHYPRELLRACGFHPVEVWGPPGVDAAASDAHLQAYTCPIVRNATAFVLDGGLDVADVLLVPHTCDALQGMGSVLTDFAAPRMPVVTLYLPRGDRPVDYEYAERELRVVAARLGEAGGVVPGDAALSAAVQAEAEADAALARLARHRTGFAVSDRTFFTLLRSREYLPAERFCELAAAVPEGPLPDCDKTILLSGIVPEPMEVFDHVEACGGRVVGDDLACCSRRLYPAGVAADPWTRMAERLLDAPPDSTRGTPIEERVRFLSDRAAAVGARGVLFYGVTFCEPELFDLPLLRRGLQERGLHVMDVEVELTRTLPGQVATRVEAFLELL